MAHTIDPESLAQYVEGVRRLAYSLLGNAADAEDVVQDTMVAALQSRATRASGPRAWLAGVTRNKVRNLMRASGRRRTHEVAAARGEALPSTSELVVRAAEQSRLLEQVVLLEEPYREAILLRYIEGKPPREIAAHLELPVETVRTRLRRGLERLRTRLDAAHGGMRERWQAALLPLAPSSPSSASPLPSTARPLWGGVIFGLMALVLLATVDWDASPKRLDLGVSDRTDLASVDAAGGAAKAQRPDGGPVEPVEDDRQPPGGPAGQAVADAEPAASPAPAFGSVENGGSGEAVYADPLPAGAANQILYADTGYACLDPAHANPYRVNDERLILALFEGLTTLSPETGKAQPGAAESWTSSTDGKTWTFKLRKSAKWSDGSPVTATDFVSAWRRLIDPYTESQWTWLYRSIKGCGVIADNAARIDGYNTLRSGLKNLKTADPNGIPGEEIISLLDDTSVRPFLTKVKSRSVRRMLSWEADNLLPPEMVDKAISDLRNEKIDLKEEWETDFEAFGRAGSGIHASDDHTLVVTTEGDVPFLPELLARSAFVPLHSSVKSKRDKAFEPGSLVGNGPFVLHGRGSVPPANAPATPALSVVDIDRSPTYDGPNKARCDRITCITDQGLKEDLIDYEKGRLQWVCATWRESPTKKQKPDVEGLKGYRVRQIPVVLCLRFRCDRAPFDNKAARMAFSLSVDRDAIATAFWPGGVPAHRLVPAGIEGRVEGIRCPDANTSAAKAAQAKAGVENETWVELSYGEAPGHGAAASRMIRDWKKTLGIESGSRIENDNDVRNVLRSGNYYAMITAVRGFANDPFAYLAPLHSADADSGLGWRDTVYDTLIDAARDPQKALCDPDTFIANTGAEKLRGALEAAKSSQEGRLRFRREALAVAEQRILDEYVVVPLLFLKEALLVRDMQGLGTDKAQGNPGFVTPLWNVSRR